MTKKQTGLIGFWNQSEVPGKAEWKEERIRILRHPMIDFEKIGITNDRMFGTVFRNEKECKELLQREYYVAAEPPVRRGESHLSGQTEPPCY